MIDSDGMLNGARRPEPPAGSAAESPLANPADDCPANPADDWRSQTPAHSIASYEAFIRDLPSLLQTHPGLCAAYENGVRVGIGRRTKEFYHELYRRGCSPTQLHLFKIELQVPLEVEVTWLPDDEVELEQHADHR